MNDTYKNAVDHLRFPDLRAKVMSKAPARPGFRLLRMGLTAAILCVLLGTSVFAAGQWIQENLVQANLGEVHIDLENAQVMELTEIGENDGVTMHYMELNPGKYYVDYSFRNGMLYSPREGFYLVTEDYTLEHLAYKTVSGSFEKNGMTYRLDLKYVETEGGIYNQGLNFIPVNDGEVLTTVFSAPNYNWPVYVDLETGAIRDALPDFDASDFEGKVTYAYMFREGILLPALVEQMNGNTDTSYHTMYWIKDGSDEAVRLSMPENAQLDFVENDAFYVRTVSGYYYQLNEDLAFQKVEGIPRAKDGLDQGLLTVSISHGKLGIVDLTNQTVYCVSDLQVWGYEIHDGTGYNASRHSHDGRIAVTNTGYNWPEGKMEVEMIAVVDQDSGELQMLEIMSGYDVKTFGWLDDDRYAVIYSDGPADYLYIYEFD